MLFFSFFSFVRSRKAFLRSVTWAGQLYLLFGPPFDHPVIGGANKALLTQPQ
jgi:hypothetical protein